MVRPESQGRTTVLRLNGSVSAGFCPSSCESQAGSRWQRAGIEFANETLTRMEIRMRWAETGGLVKEKPVLRLQVYHVHDSCNNTRLGDPILDVRDSREIHAVIDDLQLPMNKNGTLDFTVRRTSGYDLSENAFSFQIETRVEARPITAEDKQSQARKQCD